MNCGFVAEVKTLSSITFTLLLICASIFGQESKGIPELDEPVILKPVWKKGKTYRFTTDTSVQIELPGRGSRSVTIKQQARLDVNERDKKDRAGVKVTGLTEHLVVEILTDAKKLTYDSLDPVSRETTMGRHFQTAMARRMVVEVNNEGRIISSEEKGRATSLTPLPGMPEFGPEELEQLVGLVSQGYPEGVVKPGDTWELRGMRRVGQAGEMEFEIMYRHAGQTKHEEYPCNVIEFGGRMKGDVPANQVGEPVAGGSTVGFTGNRIEGRMLFDPNAEMVRLIEQTVSTSLNMPSTDAAAPPIQVPLEQSIVSRLMQITDQKE